MGSRNGSIIPMWDTHSYNQFWELIMSKQSLNIIIAQSAEMLSHDNDVGNR